MKRQRLRGFTPQYEIIDNKEKILISSSVTDLSKWIPGSDSPHNLNGAVSTSPIYDYPDGKDDGINISFIHHQDLDITEVDYITNQLSAEVKKRVEKVVEDNADQFAPSGSSKDTSSD